MRAFLLLTAVSFAACSNGSPLAPSADGIATAARGPTAVAGVYELSFRSRYPDGVWKDVQTLPVRVAELLLRAHVTDSAGQPAAEGSVTIQYCSYGGPTGDIN